LRQAGIDVEIVPGITAGLAAAAKMGISLTDRRRAEQLLFISAHRVHGKQNSDWQALVNSRTTVVVYMPGEYAGVAEGLRKAGLSDSTPCAIVSMMSSPDERWHQTTIGALHNANVMPSPTVLIVGETVKMAAEEFRSQVLRDLPVRGDLREPAAFPTPLLQPISPLA
jgi:uroporphyrin-III C-methyltransferase